MTNVVTKPSLSLLGLTMAVSAALVVLFVLCTLGGLAFPLLQAPHAWVALFTLAPLASPQAWLEGIFFSLAMGIITGSIIAAVHNAVAGRGL